MCSAANIRFRRALTWHGRGATKKSAPWTINQWEEVARRLLGSPGNSGNGAPTAHRRTRCLHFVGECEERPVSDLAEPVADAPRFDVPGCTSPRLIERDDYAALFEAESGGQRVQVLCLAADILERSELTQAFVAQAEAIGLLRQPADRRQLFLPVGDNYFCRSGPGSTRVIVVGLVVVVRSARRRVRCSCRCGALGTSARRRTRGRQRGGRGGRRQRPWPWSCGRCDPTG